MLYESTAARILVTQNIKKKSNYWKIYIILPNFYSDFSIIFRVINIEAQVEKFDVIYSWHPYTQVVNQMSPIKDVCSGRVKNFMYFLFLLGLQGVKLFWYKLYT